MIVLVIRHRVEDYGRWRAIFDEDADVRHAHGSQREQVFHDVANDDEVLAYLEWDDAERARLFARSVDLREAMVESGVIDHPDVWILKEVDRTAF
jgi:hypothetical protein